VINFKKTLCQLFDLDENLTSNCQLTTRGVS